MSLLPIKRHKKNCCTRHNFCVAPAKPGSVSNQGHVLIASFPSSHSTFSIVAVTCQTKHCMFTIHYLSAEAAAFPAVQKTFDESDVAESACSDQKTKYDNKYDMAAERKSSSTPLNNASLFLKLNLTYLSHKRAFVLNSPPKFLFTKTMTHNAI